MSIEQLIEQYNVAKETLVNSIIDYLESYNREVNFWISCMDDLHITYIDGKNMVLIDADGFEWSLDTLEIDALLEVYNTMKH